MQARPLQLIFLFSASATFTSDGKQQKELTTSLQTPVSNWYFPYSQQLEGSKRVLEVPWAQNTVKFGHQQHSLSQKGRVVLPSERSIPPCSWRWTSHPDSQQALVFGGEGLELKGADLPLIGEHSLVNTRHGTSYAAQPVLPTEERNTS